MLGAHSNCFFLDDVHNKKASLERTYFLFTFVYTKLFDSVIVYASASSIILKILLRLLRKSVSPDFYTSGKRKSFTKYRHTEEVFANVRELYLESFTPKYEVRKKEHI